MTNRITNSSARYGSTAKDMRSSVNRAIGATMNSTSPTGGVSTPSSRPTMRNMPYWIGCIPSTCTHKSEEHTSELQSLRHLVCRLLLEKKKKKEKDLTIR